ncbi:MAG TPA: hypothetical protein VHE35_04680 [Kofleriaceae bacterium]|nr:hypothetical protein [Kofleriaceae bacterium]
MPARSSALWAALFLAAAACSGDDGGTTPVAAGWRPPDAIGATDTGGFAPKLATAPNGDIYLVFYGDHEVWARRWVAATAAWDPLFRLNDGTTNAANPVLAVDAAGDAVVTWWGDHAQPIEVASFDASAGWPAGWSTIDAIPAQANTTAQPSAIALADDGSAAMVWVDVANDVRTIGASIREAGGAWTAPVRISGDATYAEGPSIALADLGDELRVVAIWEGPGIHTEGDVMTYSKTAHAGTWEPPVQLDTETSRRALPRRVAIDAAGRALAMFEVSDAYGQDAEVITARHDGGWSPPEVMSTTPSENGADPSLAVDDEGHAMLSWRECATTCRMMTRRYTGGAWQPAVAVAGVDTGGAVAISGDHALVVWSEQEPNGGWESMHGASFDGTAWSAPQLLETEDQADNGTTYDVTLRHGHAGLAAWVRGVGEPPHLMRSISGALFGDP